jgi:hypothetical protein
MPLKGSWAARTAQPVLGSRLSLELPESTSGVRIAYRTAPEASALQWLHPAQAAGGRHPFLFSQCQAIHTRSVVPLQDTPRCRLRFSAEPKTVAATDSQRVSPVPQGSTASEMQAVLAAAGVTRGLRGLRRKLAAGGARSCADRRGLVGIESRVPGAERGHAHRAASGRDEWRRRSPDPHAGGRERRTRSMTGSAARWGLRSSRSQEGPPLHQEGAPAPHPRLRRAARRQDDHHRAVHPHHQDVRAGLRAR